MRLLTSYSLLLFFLFSCEIKKDVSSKDSFRFNITTGLTSLDPAFASNKPKWWLTNQLYNGLLEVNENLELMPSIATSWNLSSDQKVYTFHIRKGVFFHDSPAFKDGKGREVNAQDVAYSLKRILTTGTGAWVMNDKLLRVGGKLSDKAILAVNDSVFQITLSQSCPFFLHILTMPYCYIVPKEAVEYYGENFRERPVGTGPFRFVSWYEDNKLILAKNECYWKSTPQNILPKLDYIEVSFIADANQEFRFFMNKKLDLVSTIEEGTRDEIFRMDGTMNEKFEHKLKIERSPYLITDYLGFQLDITSPCYQGKDHPYLDVYVRKALNAAIDKEAMVNYYKAGLGFPADQGMIPRGIHGYESSVKPLKNKAIDYLKKSRFYGKMDQYSLKLQCSTSSKTIAEFLQKQWEQALGLSIAIDVCDGGTLNTMANAGKSAFFYAGWIADYPDPENFMALFYSPHFKPKGPNKMHFKDEVVDSLFHIAGIKTDRQSRYKDYARIDAIAMDHQAVIPLFHEESVWLSQKYVLGLKNNPSALLKLETVSFKK